jgi:Predicted membrane protein
MKDFFSNINRKKLAIIVVFAIALIVAATGFLDKKDSGSNQAGASTIKKVIDKDLIIQTKDVTKNPTFYPVKIDGTDMEVIAVKASDGSIRTAFNTCQVCNNSGKGYYKVEGNQLVCQNCGNRFGIDDVEVARGGCNPVPISDQFKTVSDNTITISKDVLNQAKVLFQNWK